mgnify:CR=1 FL=1
MYSDDASSETLNEIAESYKKTVMENGDSLAKYVKELEFIAKAQKEEAKILAEEAKKTEAKAAKVLEDIANVMQAMELKELQAGPYKFKFKKGSEIVKVDENELPEKYFVEVPATKKPLGKPELKKIIKESGISIPGVEIKRNPDRLELK